MKTPPPIHYGHDNNRYNGGLCFDRQQRRWIICCRDGTQVLYARGVMAAHIGRLLRPDEIVHHINEDTQDDRVENLQLTTRAEHMAIHREHVNAARTYETGDQHWTHRHPERRTRGDRHGNTKISDADVAAIRAAAGTVTGVELARRYGVHPRTIYNILRGKTRLA